MDKPGVRPGNMEDAHRKVRKLGARLRPFPYPNTQQNTSLSLCRPSQTETPVNGSGTDRCPTYFTHRDTVVVPGSSVIRKGPSRSPYPDVTSKCCSRPPLPRVNGVSARRYPKFRRVTPNSKLEDKPFGLGQKHKMFVLSSCKAKTNYLSCHPNCPGS